jgi:hypothetical protein
MRHVSRWVAAGLVIAALGLAGCGQEGTATTARPEPPAQVTSVDGATTKRVTLSERATERLGIETAAVTRSMVTPPDGGKSAPRKTVPYSALLYDVDGNTWVFTTAEPRSYMRQQVAVEYVDGEQAVLSSGPPAGTLVVTVGAAALYGTELGVGDDAE